MPLGDLRETSLALWFTLAVERSADILQRVDRTSVVRALLRFAEIEPRFALGAPQERIWRRRVGTD
jgi:hypothetical protein